ncbi:unnamed protein product, partial [Linum tenue]
IDLKLDPPPETKTASFFLATPVSGEAENRVPSKERQRWARSDQRQGRARKGLLRVFGTGGGKMGFEQNSVMKQRESML